MIQDITALGWGIVTLALIIGLGTALIVKFGATQASCPTGYPYNASWDQCTNTTDTASRVNPSDSVWTNNHYLVGQLGQSGLAGYVPLIIIFVIAMMFIGKLFIDKGQQGSY